MPSPAKPRRRSVEAGTPSVPPRQGLTLERIVETALALLDTVGLEGLTMRRLAEELSVQASALYRHVRDKAELLEMLADAICAEQPEPDPTLSWSEQLRFLAEGQLRILLARRDAARIIAGTAPNGPERLRLIEATIRPLLLAGVGGEEAMQISMMLSNYVIGLVLEDELSPLRRGPGEEVSDREIAVAGAAWRDAFASGHYPSLTRSAAAIDDMAAFGVARRFSFGFELLLAGLTQRITAKQ